MRKLRHQARVGDYNLLADNYETPQNALEMILRNVPREKIIWDPFYCDGRIKEFFSHLGYTCIHERRDFFEYEPFLYELIVTNPPYSIKEQVLKRLLALGRPFAVLMPLSTIATSYFYELMRAQDYQMVVSRQRFNFLRHNDEPKTKNKVCTFPTVWITMGMSAYLGANQIVHRETNIY